jgi:hypothetical protein
MVKYSSFIRSLLFVLLIMPSVTLLSQTNYYKEKNYISLSTGFLFNHPLLSHNAFNIRRAVSFDHQQAVAWFHFISKRAGWMLRAERSTQSVRYKYTDSISVRGTHKSFNTGWPHDRYTATLGISYNFMAARKLNFLLVAGPQVYNNRYVISPDSIPYKFKGPRFIYNTRHFGVGIYLGVHLVYRLSDRFLLFLQPSYQRGFVKIREAKVGWPSKYSVLSYYGSGTGISAGLLFYLKKKEATEEPPGG